MRWGSEDAAAAVYPDGKESHVLSAAVASSPDFDAAIAAYIVQPLAHLYRRRNVVVGLRIGLLIIITTPTPSDSHNTTDILCPTRAQCSTLHHAARRLHSADHESRILALQCLVASAL